MSKRKGLVHRTLVTGGVVGVLSFAVFTPIAGAQKARITAGPGVSVTVRGSVDQTVAQLKKMVAGNGMMVMGELHQGKVLEMTGLKTQSETIFVGNPDVGKKLFTAEPGAGVAVPIRINIYADGHGHTIVRYVPPSRQLEGFGNGMVNEITKMLDGKLNKMVSMLAQ